MNGYNYVLTIENKEKKLFGLLQIEEKTIEFDPITILGDIVASIVTRVEIVNKSLKPKKNIQLEKPFGINVDNDPLYLQFRFELEDILKNNKCSKKTLERLKQFYKLNFSSNIYNQENEIFNIKKSSGIVDADLSAKQKKKIKEKYKIFEELSKELLDEDFKKDEKEEIDFNLLEENSIIVKLDEIEPNFNNLDNQVDFIDNQLDKKVDTAIYNEAKKLFNNKEDFKYIYHCNCITELIFCILHYLVLNNYSFKICKHCKKYFAIKGKGDYCPRKSKLKGYEDKSCKQAVKTVCSALRENKEDLINKLRKDTYVYNEDTYTEDIDDYDENGDPIILKAFTDEYKKYRTKIKDDPSIENIENLRKFIKSFNKEEFKAKIKSDKK